MSAVATGKAAAEREASLTRPPGPRNSVMKRLRRFWVAIRSLKAELLAFPVRMRRDDHNLIVMADLPGLRKEEIRVELTESVLVIEAEPNREEEAFFRRAGRRLIALPDGAGIDRAKAELKNGILTVSLPLSRSRKNCKVLVEEAIDIDLPRADNDQVARKSASAVRDDQYAAV